MQAQANNTQANNANVMGAHVVSIIPRTDLLGHNVLFLADTHNREAGTIQYWDGKKGNKPQQAPVEFYKSTKPIKGEEDAKKLMQDFSQEFGVKEFIPRQRLVKESALPRSAEGSISADDIEAYKTRLIAAITKAIKETV